MAAAERDMGNGIKSNISDGRLRLKMRHRHSPALLAPQQKSTAKSGLEGNKFRRTWDTPDQNTAISSNFRRHRRPITVKVVRHFTAAEKNVAKGEWAAKL